MINRCSKYYWLVYLSIIPIYMIITYLVSIHIKKEYAYRISINFPFNSNDISWNNTIIWKFAIYGFASGIISGLLGLGGGLIMGPLFIELGIHPLISTQTSNFLMVFSSFCSVTLFVVYDMIKIDYSLYCITASIFGAIFGNYLMIYILKKTHRTSFIIIVLSIILIISTIVIPTISYKSTIDRMNQGFNVFKFHSPC